MTTTVSVERAMAEAKEVQERGIVGIYPLSLVALAAEIEALRKAFDIAMNHLEPGRRTWVRELIAAAMKEAP